MKNTTDKYLFSSLVQENLSATEPELIKTYLYWNISLDPRIKSDANVKLSLTNRNSLTWKQKS
jgi:hypothetical protein